MNTLFDKIWDKHVVQIVEDGPTHIYIDRYTFSPQPSLLSRSNITSGIRWYASTRTQDVPSRPDFLYA